jgi:hypothetical protein
VVVVVRVMLMPGLTEAPPQGTRVDIALPRDSSRAPLPTYIRVPEPGPIGAIADRLVRHHQ